jgi:hypothetical protein
MLLTVLHTVTFKQQTARGGGNCYSSNGNMCRRHQHKPLLPSVHRCKSGTSLTSVEMAVVRFGLVTAAVLPTRPAPGNVTCGKTAADSLMVMDMTIIGNYVSLPSIKPSIPAATILLLLLLVPRNFSRGRGVKPSLA